MLLFSLRNQSIVGLALNMKAGVNMGKTVLISHDPTQSTLCIGYPDPDPRCFGVSLFSFSVSLLFPFSFFLLGARRVSEYSGADCKEDKVERRTNSRLMRKMNSLKKKKKSHGTPGCCIW